MAASLQRKELLSLSKKISTVHELTKPEKRQFWGWLNAIFNKPDNDRIKEVGPDRSCAEWLLRCGGHVRWKDSERFHTEYNLLPAGSFHKYVIEEVNADNAAVMGIGFPHFNGCQYITKMRLHYCNYLDDSALCQLSYLKDSLRHLEISSCGNVTQVGIKSLTQLSLLQTLVLFDLPEVIDKPLVAQHLTKGLPGCTLDWPDMLKDPSKVIK